MISRTSLHSDADAHPGFSSDAPQPLFDRYPSLREKVPFIGFGSFPTPVERLEGLERILKAENIFVKREDLCSDIYGGNKVRSLEFILAEAIRKRATHTINFGYAGSNQTLACSIFARKSGLYPISQHLRQPRAEYVRKNLLYQLNLGTEFHHFGSYPSIYTGTVFVFLNFFLKTGKFPFYIPPGGTNSTGILGTIGAAFELATQIKEGQLPKPDLVYLPLGSCGTTTGLAIGILATGLETKIRAVKVSNGRESTYINIKKMFGRTVRRLRRLDPSFPLLKLTKGEVVEVIDGYVGKDYAHFTEKGMEAINTLANSDGIKLDGTYTGKAMACLVDDAKSGRIKGKTVLFWNTFNSIDFNSEIAGTDYRGLPTSYHEYFEKDYQPLEPACQGVSRKPGGVHHRGFN